MANTDRCYYRTSTFDPETNLPLYVLDTTFLPSSIINGTNNDKVTQFIDTLISHIPHDDHSLVLFTNGFYQTSLNQNGSASSDPSSLKIPLNIMKILKLIPAESKQFLKKIFIVHSNWILKSILDISNKFYSGNKNKSKLVIINCENITALSRHIDITKIPISLHTYIIDKIQYKNNKIILNRHFNPIYGRPLTIYSLNKSNQLSTYLPFNQFSRIFNNLVAYLSNKSLDIQLSSTDWQTIIRCSALSNETKISIDILSDCLKRDQLVVLSDYSFLEHYMILVKFILKLSNSKFPLIPLELLLSYNVDFNNLKQVNNFFNKVLTYRHPLLDFDNVNHNTIPTTVNNEIDSYDNAYILIKIFKLFKFLSLKLDKETHILEPNAKNRAKSIERQSLRLVLAFTKILYTDNEDSLDSTSADDDDIGFDNLFKLVRSVNEHFDTLKVLNTQYTLDDFNNHVSFDDFLAFENFKNQQLGVQDVLESKIINPNKKDQKTSNNTTTTSPVKPKRIIEEKENIKPQKLKFDSSASPSPVPAPPTPRKNNVLYVNSSNKSAESKPTTRSVSSSSTNSQSSSESTSSSSYLPTAADSSIPITKSEIEIMAKSVESLGIDDPNMDNSSIDLYTTPQRNNKAIDEDNETINDMVTDLLTPTPQSLFSPPPRQLHSLSTKSSNQSLYSATTMLMKNNNLRKYTEKDLAVQQEVEKAKQAASIKEQQAKEVELGVRRGERKVSRLARLYEEKYMQ